MMVRPTSSRLDMKWNLESLRYWIRKDRRAHRSPGRQDMSEGQIQNCCRWRVLGRTGLIDRPVIGPARAFFDTCVALAEMDPFSVSETNRKFNDVLDATAGPKNVGSRLRDNRAGRI